MLNKPNLNFVEDFNDFLTSNEVSLADFKNSKIVKENISEGICSLKGISMGLKGLTSSLWGIACINERSVYITKEGAVLETIFSDQGWIIETMAISKIQEKLSDKVRINCYKRGAELKAMPAYQLGREKGDNINLSEKCIYHLLKDGVIDVKLLKPDFSLEVDLTPLDIARYLQNPITMIQNTYDRLINSSILAEKLGRADGLEVLSERIRSINFNEKEKVFFNFYTSCKANGKYIDVLVKGNSTPFLVKNPIFSKMDEFCGYLIDGNTKLPISSIESIVSAKKKFGLF